MDARSGPQLDLRREAPGASGSGSAKGPSGLSAQGFAPEQAARELCGETGALRALREQLLRLAPLDTTVLVTGETGTGKGVTARLLHGLSGRRGPFVHADCASLPPTLFESELFGHERGAFTGASARRVGRVERAQHGTLFLDEIGELEPTQQARLLRVLQDRRFERLGGGEPLPCTARVVAATSRDLRAAVRAGAFRADLYYRLAVARLRLPPLRERREDVPRLARIALARIAQRLDLPEPRLSSDALACLAAAPWPGNVRELHNALERLVIACHGRAAGPEELRLALDDEGSVEPGRDDEACGGSAAGGWSTRPGRPAAAPSREAIDAALRACGGNVTRAARRLGLARTTLRRRLAQIASEPAGSRAVRRPDGGVSPAPATPLRSAAGARSA